MRRHRNQEEVEHQLNDDDDKQIDHDRHEFGRKYTRYPVSPWMVVSIAVTLLGINLAANGLPNEDWLDFGVFCLFAAFVAWNYWPRPR